MNRNYVAKFGGSSVKTAEAINKAAHIIENNMSIRVVVLSAVGGITDLCVQFCQAAYQERCHLLKKIMDVHLTLVKELNLNNRVNETIVELLSGMDKFCSLDLNLEHCDEILSMGERLSSLIVYYVLQKNNVMAQWIDARKIVITNDHFGKAVPELGSIKACCQKLNQTISEDMIIVTQGFIGATPDGRTTTLGRGGSDYSAALIAEAIDAENLYIYTDVKGVYTMDPRIVKNAALINQISFQEMAELANFGAKILHPATLAPCLRSQIPVTILSTFEPTQGETRIIPDQSGKLNALPKIRAIALRKKQILVTIRSLNMLNACGFLANVFSILARYKITVDLITTSEVSVALTIDGTSLGSHEINPFKNEHILEELKSFAEISIEENLSLVTVVGPGLMDQGTSQGILGKVIDYAIRLICYGASTSNIGFLVATDDSHAIVMHLHETLIEKNSEYIGSHINLEAIR